MFTCQIFYFNTNKALITIVVKVHLILYQLIFINVFFLNKVKLYTYKKIKIKIKTHTHKHNEIFAYKPKNY